MSRAENSFIFGRTESGSCKYRDNWNGRKTLLTRPCFPFARKSDSSTLFDYQARPRARRSFLHFEQTESGARRQ